MARPARLNCPPETDTLKNQMNRRPRIRFLVHLIVVVALVGLIWLAGQGLR